MSIQVTIRLSDVPELLEKLRANRQFHAVLERDRVAIIGRISSDPDARRELASNRSEIDLVNQAIRELEEQIDTALERRPTTTQP